MHTATQMMAWAKTYKTNGVWLPIPRPFPQPFIAKLHFNMLEKELLANHEEVECAWLCLCDGFYKMTQTMDMEVSHQKQQMHWYAMGASNSGFIYANRFTINSPFRGAPLKFDARKEFFIPSYQANIFQPVSSVLNLNGSDNQYGQLIGSKDMIYTISSRLTDMYSDRSEHEERFI